MTNLPEPEFRYSNTFAKYVRTIFQAKYHFYMFGLFGPVSCTLSASAHHRRLLRHTKGVNFFKKEIGFMSTKMKQWPDLDLHLLDWFVCFQKITLWVSQNEKRKNFIMGDSRSYFNEFRSAH